MARGGTHSHKKAGLPRRGFALRQTPPFGMRPTARRSTRSAGDQAGFLPLHKGAQTICGPGRGFGMRHGTPPCCRFHSGTAVLPSVHYSRCTVFSPRCFRARQQTRPLGLRQIGSRYSCATPLSVTLLRNARKTECDANLFLIRLKVRAAPFALLRNTRKTECGANLFLIRLAVSAAPFALQ